MIPPMIKPMNHMTHLRRQSSDNESRLVPEPNTSLTTMRDQFQASTFCVARGKGT
jgi:hypothetical protein